MTRGEGSRRRVLRNTTIPKSWSSFLRNSDNKRELFCYISEQIEKMDIGDKIIYTTHLDRVLTTRNAGTELTADIEPCNHEESDTRMLHCMKLVVLHASTTSVNSKFTFVLLYCKFSCKLNVKQQVGTFCLP